MATKLEKPLKREVMIEGNPYMRNGIEIAWKDLVSGDAALAMALNASIQK